MGQFSGQCWDILGYLEAVFEEVLGYFGTILGHFGEFGAVFGYFGTFREVFEQLFGIFWGVLGIFGPFLGVLVSPVAEAPPGPGPGTLRGQLMSLLIGAH